MQRISIYLAGNIQKSHSTYDEQYWTAKEIDVINKILTPIKVDFLNPSERMDDIANQKSVFGRDMTQVFSADIVFVDARQRRGLGVGAEMMWAKVNNKPVVVWVPEDSYYNQRNVKILENDIAHFIHPFVEHLADALVDTVEQGAEWIKQNITKHQTKIRGVDYIKEAMLYYQANYLDIDSPMQKIIKNNEKIRTKLLINE